MLPYFHSSKSGTQSSVRAAALGVQAGAECQFRCYHRGGDVDVEIPPKRCSLSTHPSLNSGTLHSILYLEEKRDSNDFHAKQSLHTTMNIDVEETNTISSLLLRF